jgi:mono/diheme cytochrome c family protein
MRRVPLGIAVTLLAVACGGGKQDQATAGADSVGIALAQYSPALFDSITWAADSAEINRGSVVWAWSCKRCHGETGAGDGNFVTQVKDSTGAVVPDTLMPPTFLTPGWQYATDKQALIKYIYTGSGQQPMPHWGLSGQKPRDIDAVAAYIQQVVIAPKDTTAAKPAK